MPVYIQKYPEQIEAIQFTGNNFAEIEEFAEGVYFKNKTDGSAWIGIIEGKAFYINDYIERFDYGGIINYTISDKEDFEEYYKLLS